MARLGDRRWWALGGLLLCVLVVGLDITVLNVALPTLAAALHASTGDLEWFSAAYTLVLAALLLPAGLLGDRYGRKRVLLIATAVFGAASAASAYAGSPAQLIAARAVMGAASAFLTAMAVGVIPALFAQHERPRALGVTMTAMAAGMPLGPIIGGYLLHHFWWGSVFMLNVPVVAVGLIVAGALLPESRAAVRPGLDAPGVLLSSCGLAALVYATIGAGDHPWLSARVAGWLAAGVVLLVAFVVWERRTPRPLVDLTLFRDRAFVWGTALATLTMFAMAGVLFLVPQYLQDTAGHDALGTGVRLLPSMGGLLIGAPIGTRLLARLGSGPTIAAGCAVIAVGLGLGALTGAHTAYGFVAAWLAVFGAGLGLALPTAMDAAMSGLSAERSGTGSALIMAVRQVGGAFGAAILGSVFSGAYRARLDVSGLPAPLASTARDGIALAVAIGRELGDAPLIASARTAFTHGMSVALIVCAALAALGALAAAAFLPRTAGGPADTRESGHELTAT